MFVSDSDSSSTESTGFVPCMGGGVPLYSCAALFTMIMFYVTQTRSMRWDNFQKLSGAVSQLVTEDYRYEWLWRP